MPPTDAPPTLSASQQNKFPYLKPHQFPGAYVRPLKKHKNMEVRARAGKHHGQLPFGKDLANALYGYGNPTHPDIPDALTDNNRDSQNYLSRPIGATNHSGAYNVPTQPPNTRPPTPFNASWVREQGRIKGDENNYSAPFPETVRVLDEIVTDWIIEVCHEAVDHATYEGRHKVNPQDLHWVFRKDQEMLGRLKERTLATKAIKKAKMQTQGFGEGGAGAEFGTGKKITVEELQAMGDIVGEEGTGKGKGRGRGRRKKRAKDGGAEDDGAEGGSLVGGGAGSDGGDVDGLSATGSARPSKRVRSEVT